MNKPQPPYWAVKFFRYYCREDLSDAVLGDLEELYVRRCKEIGRSRANWIFVLNALQFLQPFAIRKSESKNLNQIDMLRHYYRISLRSLSKQKLYSIINIGGLAIGMLVMILVSLWCHDELSFNKYHNNCDHIAQVKRNQTWEGRISTENWHGTALGNLLRASYGDYLKHVVMMTRTEEHMISYQKNNFSQEGKFMEPEAPEMLALKVHHGGWDGLKDKSSILLSKSLATKLFGDVDPTNEVVTFDASMPLKVTGVFEDIPRNSDFYGITYIAPMDLFFTITESDPNIWSGGNMLVYVQLEPGMEFQTMSARIKDLMLPHIDERAAAYKPELFLHPMNQWHLYSEFENGVNITSNRLRFVWLYAFIGFFVLALACINFMNLSTSQSEKRAKEIGIRKSIGSVRHQLIGQFLSESVLTAFLAFVLTVVAIWLILPWFNELVDKEMDMPYSNLWFWPIGLAFTLLTGLLAGSYPAFYLSSFNPASSLRATFRLSPYASVPRKALIIFQFTISIILMIGTLVVYQQIQYAKNRPVGYSQNGLMMIPKRADGLFGKYEIIRDELKKTGAVVEMAEANYPLTNENGTYGNFEWPDKKINITFNAIKVNYEYGKTVGWELLLGRDFLRDHRSDISGAIITESARRQMGLENPIGQNLHHESSFFGGHDYTILGVVKDLIKQSPYQDVKPGIMFLADEDLLWMFIRLNPYMGTSEAISKVSEVFRKIAPSTPFDFKFVDEEYSTKFRAEERIHKLATFFSLLAILISCLGLFGLAAFVAERRTKEIGIRKVLGASISNLWQMLSREFVTLVLPASLIAIPIAYYYLQQWLQQYEYRIEISLWMLAIPCIGAILLSLITVSYQTVKPALKNPVNSLRSE